MIASADIGLAVMLARTLPGGDVARLATAVQQGSTALQALAARSGSGAVRAACDRLSAALLAGGDPPTLAGALLGAAEATEADRSALAIDVAWTGPESEVVTSRLTSEVIVSLLNQAAREVLLIGYAVQDQPRVVGALRAAVERGVNVTLLLERPVDNHHFNGSGAPFPGLMATRLAWPAGRRPAAGAALHAKVLVVDRSVALVGSANITGWALNSNLECGVLITGGAQPAQISDHVASLRATGVLTRI